MDIKLTNEFRTIIHEKFGINVPPEKAETMWMRIDRFILDNNCTDVELLRRLKTGNLETISAFANAITTNVTSFFREKGHFDYIVSNWDKTLQQNQRIRQSGEIRVWSAGCSTGEEAYTIAMVLTRLSKDMLPKILATDISEKVVSVAQQGVYPEKIKNDISPDYLAMYFDLIGDKYFVKPVVRNSVVFRSFNLMSTFPFKNGFDIIFCRNVIIYFSEQAQNELIEKFSRVLVSGGLLFIGHSETIKIRSNNLKYLSPTIYMKT